jgi:hypothetical protein
MDAVGLGCWWVAVAAPFQNRFVVHLVLFASRVSFFFGGAFFSAVFFDHLPELEVLPPLGRIVIKRSTSPSCCSDYSAFRWNLSVLEKRLTNPPDKRGRSTAL